MKINRRKFLGMCSSMGTASITDLLCCMSLANAAANTTQQSDYKALVCIFLFGGNDSFNMLIPRGADEYAAYKKARGTLALSLKDNDAGAYNATSLKDNLESNRHFAIHSAASALLPIYAAGNLSFVSNVGTLVEPTTIEQFHKKQVQFPRSLFSHNDQRDQWQTCLPQSQSATGWLGRATELLGHQENDQSPSINISLSGNNILQTGHTTSHYSISNTGGNTISNPLAAHLFKALMQRDSDNIFTKEFSKSSRKSDIRNNYFKNVFDATSLQTDFPDTEFGQSMKTIAKTISARDTLGMNRQTFFVNLPGWDTHQDQPVTHDRLLRNLSSGMAAFDKSMIELGTHKNVTTFTASDFGRTLHHNGRGSDHGWGGNQIVMGGTVSGTRILGEYPQRLTLGGDYDTGKNGRLLPSTACDSYFAPLLRWLGVPSYLIDTVLPNYANFGIDRDINIF